MSFNKNKGVLRMCKLCKQILPVIALAIWVTGCGSQQLMNGQKEMRNSFYAGNYQHAKHIADSLKENDIYKEKDRVLYALETGTIDYFHGDFKESIQSFTNAEDYIDQFFTKSFKTGVEAFLTNDNQLNYNGEVYEDIYLNGFKSLSYLKINEFESALVEARKIVEKLGQAESKYQGLAESMSEADTTEKDIQWEAGTSNIHDSPLSHYLASAVYAKLARSDTDRNYAELELKKLKVAITNHQALPESKLEFDPDFKKIIKPNSYNTMLTAFSGNAPDKVENNLEIENVDGTGLTIAIPKLQMRPSNVEYVEAVINDTMTTHLPIIEEMDKVARETFQIKKPIIVARATVRGILKSVSQDVASDVAEEESEQLGDAVNFFAGQVRKASERADLRGWQTMPGKVYTNVVELPPGNHQISFNYYSADGELLYSQQRQIEVSEQERLEPIASIYSN